MATITIKIDSEQLAREVLTQLGYLPEDADDVPDLISDDDEPEAPVAPEEKEPEVQVEPDEKEPEVLEEKELESALDAFIKKMIAEDQERAGLPTGPESSRDAFVKEQIKKVLVDQGLVPAPPTEEWNPDPNDEGFGTPIDETGAIDLGDLKEGSLEKAVAMGQKRKDQEMKDDAEAITKGLSLPTPVPKVKSTAYENIREYIKNPLPTPLPAYEPSAIEEAARLEETKEIIRKQQNKNLKQEDEREKAAKLQERIETLEYIQYLKDKLASTDDKDIKQVMYELLGDTDPEFIKFIEENEPMPYEEWLEEYAI